MHRNDSLRTMTATRWASPAGAALLLGLTLVAASLTAAAQPTIDLDYSHIHQRTLDNGLHVVVVEQPTVPIVTIELAARNGAFTEPPELNGLSHLYEHMFFKANASYPNQEAFMARQRELGMDWNGTTGSERVNYFFTLPSELTDEGVAFMAAAIRTPRFDQEELERERVVVLGEYDRNEANPFYHLWEATQKLLWYAHPSRKDSLGERDVISTATVEQMRWMQQTYYVPNNILLVLSGDITAERGFELAEQHLGDWPRGQDPFRANPIPEHPPLRGDVTTVITQPVNISVVQMAWHGPDTRNDVEATYAADVFSFILGQDGSRFQENLVQSGVALSASIGYSTQKYVGPIYLTVVTQPGGEQRAINAVLEELERFNAPDYFTDEQLATAITLLAVDDLAGQQSSLNMAHTLSYWWCSASIDYYLNYIDNLRAVTRDDIRRYVETYIIGQPRVVALMAGPATVTGGGWTDASLLDAISPAP